MIWQERPQCVVMVTNVMEGGKTKCEQYWPSSGTQTFDPFTISVTSETTLPDFTIRTLRVWVSLVPMKIIITRSLPLTLQSTLCYTLLLFPSPYIIYATLIVP